MVSDAEDPEAVPIRPAATVIPLRNAPGGPAPDGRGIEVLVLRRNANLAFHGGSWVFPGGRIDDADFAAAGSPVTADAAIHAAVREAKEEADLDLTADQLVSFSHWTTPLGRNKRFATWFFVVHVPEGAGGDVTIDDGEIHEFEWHPIADAITGCEQGEINLAGPTYVSLLRLSRYETVEEAIADVANTPDEIFLPKLVKSSSGTFSLYQGDAGYDDEDVDAPGSRHRMQMLEKGYRYIREL